MKKSFLCILSIFAFLFTTESVSAQKRIVINSEPAGAEVFINGLPTGQTTPAMIKNPGGKSFVVTCRKKGYEDSKTMVAKQKQFDGKKAYPNDITCRLTPTPYSQDKSMPQGAAKEVVNRDAPGSTTLERTVLRWYFESQPQGARIFWRVISSCPDQVKNTNELWLGNTPFEETRSFNIQGLTYENSRDVQIEIKVRRAGYLDQTKRFNVRQAIDQQEISSFFDMIKAEE